MNKLLLFLPIFCLIFSVNYNYSQLLFEENFNYTAGDSIAAHGWLTHSISNPSNPISITSPGLTYTGYPSVSGNKASMGSFGSDNNHTFTPVTSGSVYVSFLVSIDTAKTGDYFLHISTSPLSTFNFNARVFVKMTSNNKMAFGIRKAASDQIQYGDSLYNLSTTYLLVLKYKLVPGATNDTLGLFIFTSPNIPGIEPAPNIGPYAASAQTDIDTIGCVALRQGSTVSAPALSIDGIRVSQSWATVVAVNNTSTIAQKFYLSQNYPNPFNPSTKITYELKDPSFVTLKIFDILGREVSSLINTDKPSGSHEFYIDARNLSSGIYYYQLTATDNLNGESLRNTKSMVLIK